MRTVVFGGTSGIGEAAARLLHDRGHQVIAVGRRQEKAGAARERLPGVRVETCDATSRDALDALFARLGPIDNLVLSISGGRGAGPFLTLALAHLRDGLEAKLLAQLEAAQAALPTLRPGGSITFVSAASARSALPGTVGLAAINGALEALVRPLALELAPTRVNAVSPGVIDTPWWDGMPAATKEAFFRDAVETLPVRRVGRPEHVAQAIILAVENGFVTGSVIEVDGGVHLGRSA